MEKITNFFEQVLRETKKVTWPSKPEVNKTLLVVIGSVIIFMVIFTLIDSLVYNIIQFLTKIGE